MLLEATCPATRAGGRRRRWRGTLASHSAEGGPAFWSVTLQTRPWLLAWCTPNPRQPTGPSPVGSTVSLSGLRALQRSPPPLCLDFLLSCLHLPAPSSPSSGSGDPGLCSRQTNSPEPASWSRSRTIWRPLGCCGLVRNAHSVQAAGAQRGLRQLGLPQQPCLSHGTSTSGIQLASPQRKC